MPAQDDTGGDLVGFHEDMVAPSSGNTATSMGDMLYVNQLRANADATVAGQLEDIAFDEDGVNTIIGKLEDVRQKLDMHRGEAQALAGIHQREDSASRLYATIANQGGEAYIQALEEEIAELDQLIDDVKRIRDERLWLEADQVEQIEKHG
ncbi:hypothetical protein [Haloechinothrix sp. LS1_15]|uniref:hypothetical protein n=1 Tax=Haloechinothrix sp. LS1_15 TaxID=2652248 RepID=UPI002944F663|nr:hypothetical protein [Haloechinothrix sp. LS1_15]MDV6012300.1 hypothetical protein [Haloechinothrix sp. LS1_15]